MSVCVCVSVLCSEPSVSAARSSPFADRVDSKNEVTVRPMSRSITHRRSKIIDTDALDKDSQDFSDSSSDSVTQRYARVNRNQRGRGESEDLVS